MGSKWVVTASWSSIEVICFGNDMIAVWNKAKDNPKVPEPFVFYVPKKGEKFVYPLK